MGIQLKLSETGVRRGRGVARACPGRRGGAGATETVYGLIARADDEVAIRRIFELKRRPPDKRLGWFVGDWRTLKDYGVELDGLPGELAERYTPGPLTIIARRGGDTLGFRVPDHPLLAALLAGIGEPLVQTSANASGEPDALTAEAALEMLAGEVAVAIDGGALPPGAMGSTVVDATGKTVRILRQGGLKVF